MNYSKYLIIIFLFLVFPLFTTFAQQSEVTIQFDSMIDIRDAYLSKNYLGFTLYDSCAHACLYDRDGWLIFKTDFNGIILSRQLENYGLFLVIEAGHAAYGEDEESPDIIHAFDIKTGIEKWQTTSIGSRYEISPDGCFIMPVKPSFERSFYFEVINLEDGTKLHLKHSFRSHSGLAWYDNERVVLVFQKMEENPDYKASEYFQLRQKMRKVMDQKAMLSLKNSRNILGNAQKNEEQNKLQAEYNELRTKISQLERERKVPRQKRFAASDMKIYNITKDTVEVSKEIFTSDGHKFVAACGDETDITVSVDKRKNIYLVGRQISDDLSPMCFVKLDTTFNICWMAEIESSRMAIIRFKDEIIFKERLGDMFRFIDNNSGKILSEIEFKNSNSKFKNIELTKYRGWPEINIFEELDIDMVNRRIKILNP